ncbi:MAG: hypothetical protein U0797_09055 [Gemmataceae bacterium]
MEGHDDHDPPDPGNLEDRLTPASVWYDETAVHPRDNTNDTVNVRGHQRRP